ncbi:MAG: T9SS type A sorting domain-containing protein [Flavobacterium sp. JAD_PAG50586_2]|nr:MAG: T9SS type A sorting domain-containing protein [Flavobacterium sp. JAD_PAG50586_2]
MPQTNDAICQSGIAIGDKNQIQAPITPARPGFDAVYQIVYNNKGNQTLSGNIFFTYDDTVLATLTPNTQTTGSFEDEIKCCFGCWRYGKQKSQYLFRLQLPCGNPEDTVLQSLSNPDVAVDASIAIYPSPTKGLINIECNNIIKSVQLYDVQGRILQTDLNDTQTSLDLTIQSNGIYFIKIISDNGMKSQKIVKD